MAVISFHVNPKKMRTAAKIAVTQGAGLLPCTAIILISAVIVCVTKSSELAAPLSVIAFAVGALLAGRFAGKTRGRHGIAAGLHAALLFWIFIAVIAAAAAFVSGSPEHLPAYLLTRILIAVICGVTGGVIGVNHC
ncbi:hypothetical protein FACS1894120_7060 [Clostridia bacterium]|nr:hypothetical protein FACS1894120_7060 [Clostridia bacterium]